MHNGWIVAKEAGEFKVIRRIVKFESLCVKV